jgi:hypothetical protein
MLPSSLRKACRDQKSRTDYGQLIRTLRNRKLFITTLTELKAMAALAGTGLTIKPGRGTTGRTQW